MIDPAPIREGIIGLCGVVAGLSLFAAVRTYLRRGTRDMPILYTGWVTLTFMAFALFQGAGRAFSDLTGSPLDWKDITSALIQINVFLILIHIFRKVLR